MPIAVLIGTLDTKGREYEYVKGLLVQAGLSVVVVDVGILSEPHFPPDVTAREVSAAAGVALEDLRFDREGSDTRAAAVEVMRVGAEKIVKRLFEDGRCDGVLGLGGSGGSAIISGAMRVLPFGVPKLLVSTMASGNISAYVGSSDLCVLHSVTDIAGLNSISRVVFGNAAGALEGMLRARSHPADSEDHKPAVGITMLGVTTRGALRVADRLAEAGYDPVVFHAVGSGGRAMEKLLADGTLTGVVDFTVKELTDDRYGGIFRAGPDRIRTAGLRGLPQVIVPGAIEVLNFGVIASVPAGVLGDDRRVVQHNEQVTAVRLTAAELVHMAGVLADRVNLATGPTAVIVPTRGFDSYAVAGGPFADPEADRAFIDELTARLLPSIEVSLIDHDINDLAFADAVASTFVRLSAGQGTTALPEIRAEKRT